MYKSYSFIYIFIFTFVFCSAQSNLSLLSNQYNSFFTEVDGELWVASAGNGFNRYRGIDTKHYRLNDSLGLKGTYVQSPMFKVKEGLLWTSTYEYLCVFDKKTDRFQSFQIEIKNDTIKTGYRIFHYDPTQHQIYARVGDQMVIINAQTRKIERILGITVGNEFTLNGDVIIGSPWQSDRGLEKWTKIGSKWVKKHEYFSTCEKFNKMSVTKSFYADKTWWLLTTIGLVQYNEIDPCRSILHLYSPSSKDNAVSDGYYKANYIYTVSDQSAVQVFDILQRKFIDVSDQMNEKVDYVYVDQHNQVWKSNIKNGIHVIPQTKLFDTKTRFDSGNWDRIIPCGNHKILLDKEHGFVVTSSIGSYQIKTSSPHCPFSFIHSITPINENEVILAGLQSFGLYNLTTKKFNPIKLQDIDGIQHVYYKNHNAYITSSNKIFNFNTDSWQKIEIEALIPFQGTLQTTHYISDEINIYSASSSQLLIDIKGVIQTLDLFSFINDATYDPKSKRIIVATNNGLVVVDEKFKISNAFSSYPTLHNHSIIRIEQNGEDVYFNTNTQIGRYNLKSNSIELINNIYNTIPDFYISDNEIQIASDHTYAQSLNGAFKSSAFPLLFLDKLTVNQINAQESEILDLPYNRNNISFRYIIKDIHQADHFTIQYKLKNIGQDWKTIKNGEEITFNNLAPGNYTLQVKGINAQGISSDINEQKFYINVPWYRSIWFFTLLAGLGIFSFYSYYKYNIKQLNEKYRTEMQINNLQRSALQAQMNPHFIFNCLNSIQNFIMQNEKVEAMDYLNRFAHLIRQNLEASTSSTILLSDEIEMLQNYVALEQMRFGQKFDYIINVDKKIDTNNTYIPPLLIQPFVENAIIHGVSNIEHTGMINIDISKGKDTLQITIKDNGRGITNEKNTRDHKSLAMSITSKRLDYINTTKDKNYNINTTSSDQGTNVTILVHLADIKQT